MIDNILFICITDPNQGWPLNENVYTVFEIKAIWCVYVLYNSS